MIAHAQPCFVLWYMTSAVRRFGNLPEEDYRQNNNDNNNNQIGLFVDDVNPMSDTQQKRRFCTEKYLPTCVVFSYYAVVVSARGFMAVKTRKQ